MGKVKDRIKWQNAITTRSYEMGTDCLTYGEGDKIDIEGLIGGATRPPTPDSPGSKGSTKENEERMASVRQLAGAVLQIGQMIDDGEKFLKEPLGEDEKEKKKRLKREEDMKKRKEEEEEVVEDDDEEVEEKI